MNCQNLRRTVSGQIIHLIAVVDFLAGLYDVAVAQFPRVGVFQLDASPPLRSPLGSPLAYDPCIGVEEPLSMVGVVIIGNGDRLRIPTEVGCLLRAVWLGGTLGIWGTLG